MHRSTSNVSLGELTQVNATEVKIERCEFGIATISDMIWRNVMGRGVYGQRFPLWIVGIYGSDELLCDIGLFVNDRSLKSISD